MHLVESQSTYRLRQYELSDISDSSARSGNIPGVDRFDDYVMIAYLVADQSLKAEEKYIKLIMKLLSTELGSQVFFDRQDERIQGRIKNIARLMAGEKGLERGMIVTINDNMEELGSIKIRTMEDYNKLTNTIQDLKQKKNKGIR